MEKHRISLPPHKLHRIFDDFGGKDDHVIDRDEFRMIMTKIEQTHTQQVLTYMFSCPKTYALTGYLAGCIAQFLRPELARPINRMLFPLGGAILFSNFWQEASERVNRREAFREQIMRRSIIGHFHTDENMN